MTLTRIERNQLFAAIAASALDPDECSLVDLGKTILISHNGSSSTLKLSATSERTGPNEIEYYKVEYDVDDGHHWQYRNARRLESVGPIITQWANEVKATIDVPDLWAELQRDRELIASIEQADSDNTPFTSDERRQIRVELETIKEQVKEQFDLTSEQIARIEEWKDEVDEASERIGRKDWRLLVYGTIVNLVVTDALPPEVARHILSMVIHAVVVLFGGGPPQILT